MFDQAGCVSDIGMEFYKEKNPLVMLNISSLLKNVTFVKHL